MEKFKVGDRVKHKYYGLGIIKETNPSAFFLITVSFLIMELNIGVLVQI